MIFSNNANLLHFDWCELMSVLHMMFFCKYHCSVTIGACFSMPNCRIFFPLLSQFNAHEFSCNVPSYSSHRIYFPIQQKHVAMLGTLPPCGSLSYFCFCFEIFIFGFFYLFILNFISREGRCVQLVVLEFTCGLHIVYSKVLFLLLFKSKESNIEFLLGLESLHRAHKSF